VSSLIATPAVATDSTNLPALGWSVLTSGPMGVASSCNSFHIVSGSSPLTPGLSHQNHLSLHNKYLNLQSPSLAPWKTPAHLLASFFFTLFSVCTDSCGESDLDINLSGAWGIQACFEYPTATTVETATKLAEQKSKGPGSTISWAWTDGSGGVAYKRNGMATEILVPQE